MFASLHLEHQNLVTIKSIQVYSNQLLNQFLPFLSFVILMNPIVTHHRYAVQSVSFTSIGGLVFNHLDWIFGFKVEKLIKLQGYSPALPLHLEMFLKKNYNENIKYLIQF